MKSLGQIILVSLSPIIFVESLFATPERHIYSVDTLIGSNEKAYAVLRTQYDNLGSHYNGEIQRKLLIFSKLPEEPERYNIPGPLLSEKLLLLQNTTHSSMVEEGEPLNTYDKRDDSVSLAGLLQDYSMIPVPWPRKKFEKLTRSSATGRHPQSEGLIWTGHVKERFGMDRNADYDWKLDAVSEDGNCIFMHVSSVNEDHGDQRIIALTPRRSRQVRDRFYKQELYLVVGTHDNL